LRVSHFPPAASMASRALLVKAWAWTVMSLAENSFLPVTILWIPYLALEMALASKRDSTEKLKGTLRQIIGENNKCRCQIINTFSHWHAYSCRWILGKRR